MADGQQTDVTNSEAATQTVAAATTDTTTSTTDQQTEQPADAPKDEADPLDDKGLLDGDDAEEGTEGDEEDEGDGEEASELHGAPEGEYELELPEGMALDAAALEAVTPLAKELNLSNAGLSKLAAEAYPIVEGQVSQALVQQVVAQRKEWEEGTRAMISGETADPVFAGETLEAVQTAAAKGIDRLTTTADGQPRMFPNAKPDGSEGTFRDFLKTTGLGNHPAMVQAFYLVGKVVSEDTDFIRSGGVPKGKLSREEKYYGDKAST